MRGAVVYSPQDGITLTLEGAFEDAVELQGGLAIGVTAHISYEAIHGRTLDHEPVTILEVLGFGIPNIPGLTESQQYRGQWLILGDRVAGVSDWQHTSISVRYHNLEEFVGQQPLSVPMSHEGKRKTAVSFEIPETLRGTFGGFEASTEHQGLLSIAPPFIRAEISHKAWLRIVAPYAKGTDFLSGPLHMLGCLLDLAAGHHLPMTKLRGRRGARESQIFFRQRRGSVLPKRLMAVGGHPIGFAFNLAGLSSNLTRYLSWWHEGMTRYSAAFNMYFALDPEADSDIATDFHFLSYVTALESFHGAAHEYCLRCGGVR